jgi:hypothetical protein
MILDLLLLMQTGYDIDAFGKSSWWSVCDTTTDRVVVNFHQPRRGLTYRGMLQGQVKDVYSSNKGVFPQYYFRNKLTLRYNINKYFTPYIASELYYNFNTKGHNGFSRSRYFVGLFYNLGSKSAIEIYYLIQQPLRMQANTPLVLVLGIGFSNNINWAGNANN